MVIKTFTAALQGLDAQLVTVEVDLSSGIPGLTIVGLPDATVNESKERVRAAIKNSGFDFPLKKVVINLAPANVRKEGSAFDLPLALAILIASESLAMTDFLEQTCFVGEVSLEGTLRRVTGVLSIAMMAKAQGFRYLVVPEENLQEASLVDGIEVFGLPNLAALPVFLLHPHSFSKPIDRDVVLSQLHEAAEKQLMVDFADVKGQAQAKRALELAAAGGHNLLMVGPPGSGKTLLAKALTGILPPFTFEEALEVSRIYSVAGLLDSDRGLVPERPFRSPHHSASGPGISGGGSSPRPGEITLAHRGVLFLDEFVEFPRSVLEILRQPLEDGVVTISRANQNVTYPAKFMLIAAMNPCPCGYKGDPKKPCTCSDMQVQRYVAKLSGPLLDRMDLCLDVPRLPEEELLSQSKVHGETSAQIRARVIQARGVQRERFRNMGVFTNAEMPPALIRTYCYLDEAGQGLMKRAMDKMHLSARAFDRVLRLARTIADLEASDTVKAHHVAEALQYRALDRLTRSAVAPVGR